MGVTYIAPAGTVTSPAKLITKNITDNGTYDAADDLANGYSQVVVNVEGGGGSSDFSTAEVTFVEDSKAEDGSNDCDLIAILTDRQGNELMEPLKHVSDDGDVVTAVLYKGHTYAYMSSVTSVSGNVTNNDGDLDITGDCTIHFIGIEII